MRILFNATAAFEGTSGFAHTMGLLGEMSRQAPRHEFVLLTTPAQHTLREALGNSVRHHALTGLDGSGLARTVGVQLRLPGVARRLRADLLYNKGNFHAPAVGCRQVCFIENSNPFSVLHLGEPLAYRARNRLLRLMSDQALRRAAAVVFPSERARRIVRARCRVTARTFVIPYGWELPPAAGERPQETPYILCVSSVLPHKNLLLALEALHLLRRRGTFRGRLVIVGMSGVAGRGYYRRLVEERIGERGLGSHVQLLLPVPREGLAQLYARAECLLMPSIEESFGIPLIEAMGVGAPVVAARVEGPRALDYFIPYDEICAEAAEYFDPFSAVSCADAVERALTPARRAGMLEAGRARAALYSWPAAAAATLRMLEELA